MPCWSTWFGWRKSTLLNNVRLWEVKQVVCCCHEKIHGQKVWMREATKVSGNFIHLPLLPGAGQEKPP